jgi:hypothetical protein
MQDDCVIQVRSDNVLAILVSVGQLKHSLYGLPERDFVKIEAKQGDFRILLCLHTFDQIAKPNEVA